MSSEQPQRPDEREIQKRMRDLHERTSEEEIRNRKGFLFPIGQSGVVVNSEEIKDDIKKVVKKAAGFLKNLRRRNQ